MKKLRAVIVDDEKIAREVLSNYLETYCGQKIDIVEVCDGFNSAVEVLRKTEVDVVFLDVEMPFGNGLDVLDSIGDYEFKVIFTTAFDQYAIEALNKHAFDYLLKPISIKKLMKSVDDVCQAIEKDVGEQEHVVDTEQAEKMKAHFLKIPSATGFELIKQEEIVYAKAADNYCEIHLSSGKEYIISKTLKKVEGELDKTNFLRVHKSYLVNIHHIKSFERNFGGSLHLIGDIEVPISSSGKKMLNGLL
jgi:two-component system LytT family response regulator